MKKRFIALIAALTVGVSLFSGCAVKENVSENGNDSATEELMKQIETLSNEVAELRQMLTLPPEEMAGKEIKLSDEEVSELEKLIEEQEMLIFDAPAGSNTIKPRDWSKYSNPSIKQALSHAEATFYDRLDKACSDYLNSSMQGDVKRNGRTLVSSNVIFSDLGLSSWDATSIFTWFRYNNPQYYFLDNRWSIGSGALFLYVADYVTKLEDPVKTTNEMFDKLDSWIAECSDDETTTWRKVLSMNKKICENIIYSPALKEGNQSAAGGKNQSMYSVLMTEDTVCAGYALAFGAMANAMGIDTYITLSNTHAWNAVKFDDDNYYFVDVCWNDTTNGYNENFIGVGTDYSTYRDHGEYHHVYRSDVSEWSPVIPKSNYEDKNAVKLSDVKLRAGGSGNTAIKVEWDAVKDAEKYEYQITNGDEMLCSVTTKNLNFYAYLANGTKTVKVKVRAVNSSGDTMLYSKWSEINVTKGILDNAPEPPKNIKAAIVDGKFKITWDKQSDADGYLYAENGTNSKFFSTRVTFFYKYNYVIYTSMIPTDDFCFSIMSVKKSGGKEMFSDPVFIKYSPKDGTTTVLDNKFDKSKLDAPTNFKATVNPDEKTAECSWNAVSGVDSYEVQLSYDSDFSKIAKFHGTNSGSTSAEFKLISINPKYYFRVRAKKLDYNDDSYIYSDWVTTECSVQTGDAPAKPAAPTGLTGKANAKDKATFTWNKVTGAAGYEFALFTDATHKTQKKTYSITATKASFNSIKDNTKFYFGVRAINTKNGIDVYSDWTYAEYTHKYVAPTDGGNKVTQTYSNGTYYGEVKDGVRNGYGKYTWNNGNVYEGYWLNGKQHGKGKFTWASGDVFEGDYVNGVRTGKGKYTWTSGAVYDGDWTNGYRAGKGKMVYSNGSVYEGDWAESKRNGKGKLTMTNGDVYDGDWVNDQRSGKGKYTWASGAVYNGDWVNSYRSGKGKMVYSNGSVYEGDWTESKRNGKGKLTMENGDVYDGDWVNDQRTGKGKIVYASGGSYEGEFKNGKYDGTGTRIYKDGTKQTGKWQDGKFIG